MRRQILLVSLTACFAAGCSGVTYILDNYKGVEVKEVHVEGDDDYRIFDKPSAGRMMVTSSLSSAAGQGAVKGLFLGGVDTTPPKPRFQKAAQTYLNQTERSGCRIIDGYILVSPQYEFTYDCPAPVAEKPQRKRRG